MADNDGGLPRHLDPANWFIGIGVVVSLVIGWFALGQPGAPQRDGDYQCALPSGNGLGAVFGPAAAVQNGQVVDAWYFDMATGTQRRHSEICAIQRR